MNFPTIVGAILLLAPQAHALPPEWPAILAAHAVLAPVAFALLFPLGAIIIRLFNFRNVVRFHAAWMMVTYLVALTALGLGVWIALTVQKLKSAHAVIGIVVIGALVLQPITGYVHHLLYKKRGNSGAAGFSHVWWGRAIVTLGIVNGGLGFQLIAPYQPNTRTYEIIYGVLAGFIWLLWMAVIAISYVKSKGTEKRESGAKFFGNFGRNSSTTPFQQWTEEARNSYSSTTLQK